MKIDNRRLIKLLISSFLGIVLGLIALLIFSSIHLYSILSSDVEQNIGVSIIIIMIFLSILIYKLKKLRTKP